MPEAWSKAALGAFVSKTPLPHKSVLGSGTSHMVTSEKLPREMAIAWMGRSKFYIHQELAILHVYSKFEACLLECDAASARWLLEK
mmetsp:Transcript_69849/g.169034  ORF Transcript_69849/g.169034 Transcript_69849/m.169034 type:complete len:86 (+) Transcript_69849:34-291(+)